MRLSEYQTSFDSTRFSVQEKKYIFKTVAVAVIFMISDRNKFIAIFDLQSPRYFLPSFEKLEICVLNVLFAKANSYWIVTCVWIHFKEFRLTYIHNSDSQRKEVSLVHVIFSSRE